MECCCNYARGLIVVILAGFKFIESTIFELSRYIGYSIYIRCEIRSIWNLTDRGSSFTMKLSYETLN